MKLGCYVLAGGKSSRMGQNKALLQINEISFIEKIVNELKKINKEVVIVGTHESYDFLDVEQIADIIPNKGPVGAIYTALQHSKYAHNIIVCVDSPLIDINFLFWLIKNHDSSFLLTQLKNKEKTFPLIGIYDKQLLEFFKKKTLLEELRLKDIIMEIPHKSLQVPVEWEYMLANINTKEEYQNHIK